eukprot:CAMPEP_0195540642 /NCGR_PEP_ID=MMETSP0794_2-20130614/50674_1 /TAXON_ID=515487 /ORGANISM="Stephanopyxis turris, Strain CCMP 815" /LENGTH=547 /DNA_ID=CAMNT_0040674711 /DNA_START=89 /DNA_END=1733 /DNA_ORIENTATION=+
MTLGYDEESNYSALPHDTDLVAANYDEDQGSAYSRHPADIAMVSVGFEDDLISNQESQITSETERNKRRSANACVSALIICAFWAFLMVGMLAVVLRRKNENDLFRNGPTKGTNSSGILDTIIVPPPSDDITAVCSPNFRQFDGTTRCDAACAPSACCTVEDKEQNCFDQNYETCEMYQLCKPWMVKIPPLQIKSGPSDLDMICSSESISSLDARMSCDAHCKPGLCCISKGNYNCFQSNAEICKGYSSCWNFGPDGADVYVKEVCTATTLGKINDEDSCRKVCSTRSCCFSENDDCRHKHPGWCKAFSSCENLLNLENNFDIAEDRDDADLGVLEDEKGLDYYFFVPELDQNNTVTVTSYTSTSGFDIIQDIVPDEFDKVKLDKFDTEVLSASPTLPPSQAALSNNGSEGIDGTDEINNTKSDTFAVKSQAALSNNGSEGIDGPDEFNNTKSDTFASEAPSASPTLPPSHAALNNDTKGSDEETFDKIYLDTLPTEAPTTISTSLSSDETSPSNYTGNIDERNSFYLPSFEANATRNQTQGNTTQP